MEGYKSTVGKDQMRQYMGGLYENSMVIYREYLQNACDAVELALKAGLIPNRKQANIAVVIDQYNKTITIRDVGIGVDREHIGPYLVDVASSPKYNKKLVGRHGIGRLNGANYCDAIIYETSAAGEPIKSTLVWDVKKAKEICADDSVDMDTPQIIDAVTRREPEQPEDIDAHYCNVTLVNVNDPHLMDEAAVKAYVAEIVSVSYSLEFMENMLLPALAIPANQLFEERFNSLWTYEVTVNTSPIEKSYQSEFGDVKIGVMQCFRLVDDKISEELGWGWYALNKSAKQLNDLPFSFLRARHNNFQVGSKELLNGYHYGAGAKYIIGELHVTHPEIEPSTSRDGFIGGPVKRRLEMALRKFLRGVYTQYDKASHFRSDVIDVIGKAEIEIARLKLQNKDADAEEKTKNKEQIKKKTEEKKNALTLLPKYQEYFQKNNVWFVAEDIIESVNESVIEPYNQRPLVQKTDSQIPFLKVKDYKPVAHPPVTPSTIPAATPTGGEDSVQPDNPDKPQDPNAPGSTPPPLPTPPTPSEMDYYKSLSKVERDMVKKFISVINTTDLPEKVKERMFAKLRKKIIK
ncbi:ATP-binding protein [Duncaniella muris]|uniref:ATP-binding protein n=1 Tax=Duncaniella muris TaxID=2094150 RepID=UPI001C3E4747|nr:ATP-binding protein [Duncaniella muris]